MDKEREEFWSTVPGKADHPARVLMLEAFRWIAEPLSPIAMVDVLDGELSMWDAAAHLLALERLGVVKPVRRAGVPQSGLDRFDVHYRLVGRGRWEDD